MFRHALDVLSSGDRRPRLGFTRRYVACSRLADRLFALGGRARLGGGLVPGSPRAARAAAGAAAADGALPPRRDSSPPASACVLVAVVGGVLRFRLGVPRLPPPPVPPSSSSSSATAQGGQGGVCGRSGVITAATAPAVCGRSRSMRNCGSICRSSPDIVTRMA